MNPSPSPSARLNQAFKCGDFFNFLDNPKWQCTNEDPVKIYDSMTDRQKLQFVQSYVKTYRPPDCYWGMVYIMQNVHPNHTHWAVFVPYPLDAAATATNKFEPDKCAKARFAVLDVTTVLVSAPDSRPPTKQWIAENWENIIPRFAVGLHSTAVFIDRELKEFEYFDASGMPPADVLRPQLKALLEGTGLVKYVDSGSEVCPNIQGQTGDRFCAMWSMFYLMFRLRCQKTSFEALIRLFNPQQLLELMRFFMCYVRSYLVEKRLWVFAFQPTLSTRPS